MRMNFIHGKLVPGKAGAEPIRRWTVELLESEDQALEIHCPKQEIKRQVIRTFLIHPLMRQQENSKAPRFPAQKL
jgi:hypothetical protein